MYLSDSQEIEYAMRFAACAFGLAILLWGVIDLGTLIGTEFFTSLGIFGTGFIKMVFGTFLVLAGINPDAVTMVIEVIFRR